MFYGTRINELIGATLSWANLRMAGKAYRYKGSVKENGLILVVSGEADFTINGRTYRLKGGSVALFSRGEKMAISSLGTSSFSFVVLNFSLFDTMGKRVFLSALKWPSVAKLQKAKPVEKEVLALVKILQSDQADKRALLSSKLIRLIFTLQDNIQTMEVASGGANSKALLRAVDYIYRNLNKKITLKELARQACLHESYFDRLFHKTTGQTPMAFVSHLRIERASTQLVNYNLSVGEVAELYGFQSQAHFSRKFKQVMGLSPLAFVRERKGL